ncbi:hypothetical protein [Chryseobacterium rhizosphaerae]|uniref:Tetratricopeptide repeat protein n=1 Tax=Chryseobacterium rhizosphaerae TaxID=395937 RepID=A0ABX9III7_9FLAO|nr:hypothetical protein [Chryseobacterium rhizosphaerae]REC74374.1 hypothetical protein DRF57_14010 [Chryseobacterium rhizosphaerae]GEN68271.1 hypothetical protein CRH01_28390 [Chryseobacterium rhizosphaerae]
MICPRVFVVALALILFSCAQKENKEQGYDILVEDLNFSKDVVFDSVQVPHHLRRIVRDISTLNTYQTEALAKGATENPNFENAKKLYDLASEGELLSLTDNRNNAVALYAAVGLLEINPQYATAIFQKILNRKGKVHTQNGCIIGYEYLAEPLYQHYSNTLKPEEVRSDAGLQKLDSMLLFAKNSSEPMLVMAFRNRTYSDHLKKQIEKLAFQEHRGPAILYLSNWHKKEYALRLEQEYLHFLANDTIHEIQKRKYLYHLMSFNNPDHKKVILDYIKKDSASIDDSGIRHQLENNGIYPTDY